VTWQGLLPDDPAFLSVLLAASSLRILREYLRGVVFHSAGSGASRSCLVIQVPVSSRWVKVALAHAWYSGANQDVISRDTCAVVKSALSSHLRVIDAEKAIIQVERLPHATSQLAHDRPTLPRSWASTTSTNDLAGPRGSRTSDISSAVRANQLRGESSNSMSR
jgi:hypothetical protein